MSDEIVVRGEVVKRKFIPDNLAVYQRWLDKHEGKRVEFTLAKEVKHRTNPQLAYYWGVLIWECCKELGLEPTEKNKQDIHYHFLRNIGTWMLSQRMSRYVREDVTLDVAPSTGQFTTEEMSDYISRCKDAAAKEWNVHVPDIELIPVKGSRKR